MSDQTVGFLVLAMLLVSMVMANIHDPALVVFILGIGLAAVGVMAE